jgi:excisionase family DNA binding protein
MKEIRIKSATLASESVAVTLKDLLMQIRDYTLMSGKEALNTVECALIVGISKAHLYRLVREKRIPYYKNEGGKHTYFKKSEIEQWMLRDRVKTKDEISQEADNYISKTKKL